MTSTLVRWSADDEAVSYATASYFPGHVGVTTAVRPLEGALAIVQGRGSRADAERLVERVLGPGWPDAGPGDVLADDQQGLAWHAGRVLVGSGPRTLPQSAVLQGDRWVFAGNLLVDQPDHEHLRRRLDGTAPHASDPLDLLRETLTAFLELPGSWFDGRGIRSLGAGAIATGSESPPVDLRVDESTEPAAAMRLLLDAQQQYRDVLDRDVAPERLERLMSAGDAPAADLVFSWLLRFGPDLPPGDPAWEALAWLDGRYPRLASAVRARWATTETHS